LGKCRVRTSREGASGILKSYHPAAIHNQNGWIFGRQPADRLELMAVALNE
jgi:hypothetical protein